MPSLHRINGKVKSNGLKLNTPAHTSPTFIWIYEKQIVRMLQLYEWHRLIVVHCFWRVTSRVHNSAVNLFWRDLLGVWVFFSLLLFSPCVFVWHRHYVKFSTCKHACRAIKKPTLFRLCVQKFLNIRTLKHMVILLLSWSFCTYINIFPSKFLFC